MDSIDGYLTGRRAILRAGALAVLATLIGGSALAQPPASPCPSFSAGWAKSYYGFPITAVEYDPTTQLLYVVWSNTNATAFWPVPMSVIQSFSAPVSPVTIYNTYVAPRYNALLLEEKYNCPIQQEDAGYIWTAAPTGSPNVYYSLLLQSGVPLETSNGNTLWLYSAY